MDKNKIEIPIEANDESIKIEIWGEQSEQTVFISDDAEEKGESKYQLREGCFYEYAVSKGYQIEAAISGIVIPSRKNPSEGRLLPNIHVGTLLLKIIKEGYECGTTEIEIRSIKLSYREDYRKMLGDIAEQCTELLMLHTSPVIQRFKPDENADSKTLYERFAFIKSVLESDEFDEAVQKILSSPVTKWTETETVKDIRRIRRFKRHEIRQICSLGNRVGLPENHYLKKNGILESVPLSLTVNHKTETADTPENRFVKHALGTFQYFCNDLRTREEAGERLKKESELLEEKLEHYLNHSLFKEISPLNILPLNSPVLQRKEGYREVLRVWLMFDLAAKLAWPGGEDVYDAGKRDIAVLYEYWVFFKLLKIIEQVFKIKPKNLEELIQLTDNQLCLQLKQGRHLPINGISENEGRKLNVKFSYNKTFNRTDYPDGGSWTASLRPDYTLSVWPFGIDWKTAEKEEIIVHVHFDAKYKVKDINEILGDEAEFENEKEENKKGVYKRADLLKMHAYKDAIRRTSGAYVLYPGNENKKYSGFHELIPGLGAFTLRPSEEDDGSGELREFLNKVLDHFLNRASQREKYSFRTYDTFKDKPGDEVREKLPEPYGHNRNLIPDEIHVLIGYYKSDKHLNWIMENKKYNIRTGDANGARSITSKEAGARYLLLYGKETVAESGLFYKLSQSGPKVYLKNDLTYLDYPNPKTDSYLVFDLDEPEDEFKNEKWNFKKLNEYFEDIEGAPFTVSLTDLMKAVVKES